jgi:hypothetical protein
MAKRLQREGAAKIKWAQSHIEYGGNKSQWSSGICETKMRVESEDGKDDATFDLKLTIMTGQGPSPIIGWGTVGGNKVDFVNDEKYILIPTGTKVLKVPKSTYGEWDLATRGSVNVKRAIVNAMIEKQYQNEQSLFDFSQNSITKR